VTAFAGLRVVDVSQGLAGPMAGMMLADFGADVLKVEPPGGDRAGALPAYQMWNRGKTRTTLDPDAPEGLARLKVLIAAADVAVFDHAPGRLEGLGLDGASLTARHPRLVHLWVPPFGKSGPWSHLPEHHAMLTGLTGTAFRQGGYADQPIWHVTPIVHYGQAVMAASAVAAALLDRFRTGLGQAVTVSGVHGNAEIAGPLGLLDSPGMAQGHPLGGSASYRLYQCADGEWLFLATLFPHFFDKAVEALDLRRRAAGATASMDLGALMERVFRERPRAEWLAVLAAHDVPAAPVLDRADWLASAPVTDNGLRLTLEVPGKGPVTMPGMPVKLMDTPGAVRGPAREATDKEIEAFTRPRPRPAAPTPAGDEDRPPLAGVKVLDLGTVIAGAYASAILAHFGADVVKIESAEGDPFRPFGPGFTNHNRGKRGLGLNLKDPEGRAAFLDLARGADVVLDNYRLGVRARLGIDHAALREVNPRIVSCSINAYGSTGADAALPGFDPLLQARSGMMAAQGGGAGHEPVFHSVAINDVATAAVASFGVIAALNAREASGAGQNIETCLAAQSALFQSAALTTWPGAPAAPIGERDCIGVHALERFYACADGWITLALTREAQAAALERALGGEGWAARFGPLLEQPRRGALAAEIEGRLRGLKRADALAELAAAGAPATPVLRADEARGEEWLWENGFFELRRHPLWGDLVASRAFAEFSRGACGFARLDPDLGEHGVEVLLENGFGIERIRRLAERGVIFRG
jgi:crotonobetainyl-CoA:carnitine CoA-transferase CaiB-like acyl-CoA transferase